MPALIRTKYETDEGLILRLSLKPPTAAVAGTEPTEETSSDIRPKISKSNREKGLRPRGVRLARTIGTAPDTFVKYTFVPLRSPADYQSSTYNTGNTLTIGGVVWTIVSKIPEDY